MIPITPGFITKGSLVNTPVTTNNVVTPVAPATPATKPVSVGDHITGTIVSLNRDNQAEIKFGNFTLNTKLPAGLQAGQIVTIEVLELGQEPVVKLVSTAQSTQTVLSESGKNLGALLGAASKAGLDGTLHGTKAIANSTAGISNSSEFSRLLKTTIDSSGVFYESHLYQLSKGTKTASDIAKEPQAAFKSTNIFQQLATNTVANNTIQDTLLPIVNTQLQLLDTPNITWQGQVWPNQEMKWQISREESSASNQDTEESREWSTTIKIVLPEIGEVNARIGIFKGQASIMVSAVEQESVLLLKERQALLSHALVEAGIMPGTIQINES